MARALHSLAFAAPDAFADWSVDDVVRAMRSTGGLEPLDKAIAAIRANNVNGRFLQTEEIPVDLLGEMFSSRLKQRKFVSTVAKWRMARDHVLNVRTSRKQTCVLTESEFPNLSLRSPLAEVKNMIEFKLGLELGLVQFRGIDAHSQHEYLLCEELSLTRNNLSTWGSTIFVDLDPKRLPRRMDNVVITTDTSKLDVVTGEPASETFPLAMMCGHAIGAYSMTLHIQDSLRRYQYEICCPDFQCRTKWDWDRCIRVACLDDRERRAVETKRGENRDYMTDRTKSCPNPECAAPISRPTSYKICKVHCLVCGGPYFCWRCLNPWRGSDACGNTGCATEMLLRCDTTNEWAGSGKPNVPKMRACPLCDGIVEYRRACNHIICPSCSHEFCLICLRAYSGHNSSSCSVAPRQRM